LDKPGGYLSNDLLPPFVFLDNMPNWEFGMLVQIRDITRVMRNDISRSRSQSVENPLLAEAEPLFNFHNDSWAFPSSESQYRKGRKNLEAFFAELGDPNSQTQIYARADNLGEWLSVVEKRLGNLSQRLSASVGQNRVNTDLAGDNEARQSTASDPTIVVRTPWSELDDVFYEARGTTFALIHLLKAVELDFQPTLQRKNAHLLLRQLIRELEATQMPVRSPVILNGGGFGFFANHSLVMANFISRANASIFELRRVLLDG
jgi:hypothetical protein